MKLTKAEMLVMEGRRVKLVCEERQVFDSHAGVVLDWVRAVFHGHTLCQVREGYVGLLAPDLAKAVAGELAGLLGFDVGELRPGREYYGHTCLIVNSLGGEVGYVSTGNEARQKGTVCISISGQGCTFAGPIGWPTRLHDWLSGFGAKLTRVDLAVDFFGGEFTPDEARESYVSGGFDFQSRSPSAGFFGDWVNGQARTFQVGKRTSGKLCRIYEKGHKFGDMADPWVRVEVELHNTERVLPLRMLIEPAKFFAGAYEVCELLIARHGVIRERVPLDSAVADRSAESWIKWFENTVAPSLVAFTRATGSTRWVDELVWLHRDRPAPKRLRGVGADQAEESIREAAVRRFGLGEAAGVLPSIPESDVPF